KNGPADLHRILVVLRLDTPRPVVAGAALHGVDRGSRDELQGLARLLPHVLHARMAGDVIRNLAQARLEIGLQQAVAMPQDEVFEGIEHGLAYRFDFGVLGKQERQLALEHQGARWHGSEYRIPVARELRERRDIHGFQTLDRSEVTELELGHAAA